MPQQQQQQQKVLPPNLSITPVKVKPVEVVKKDASKKREIESPTSVDDETTKTLLDLKNIECKFFYLFIYLFFFSF